VARGRSYSRRVPIAPDSVSASASAHAANKAARHAGAVLASALLESAWVTSRIAAALGLATFALGMIWSPRAWAAAPGGGRRLDPLVQALAVALGVAAVALTCGEAMRLLPGALQALVAALASVLGASGGALGLWTARTLGRTEPGALVTTGPYGVVRHPLYLALAACTTAAGLALGSLSGTLALAVLLAAVARWRARREEKGLALSHPETWPSYAARVRGFTPRI